MGVSQVALVVKNTPDSEWDMVLIPGLGRSPGGGNDNPLQYYCLENSMNRGAWWAIVQDWVTNTLPGRKMNHNEEGIMSAFKQIVELDFEKGK